MCMGSNLGPTMASFALDMIETKFNNSPLFYKRYVDDIFAVFRNKEDSEKFLFHINTFHPSLQFTIEHSVNNIIAFLDVQIHYNNNKVTTSWHIKRTNTGVYTPKASCSPMKYKTAAIRALIYRAYKLSSSIETFNKSYETITSIFINNGFHFKFINKIKQQVINTLNSPKPKKQDEKPVLYYKVPFIKELETENKTIFRKINSFVADKATVRLAYQTTKTSNFFANKDKVSDSVKSHLVYKFTCSHCGGCYTGETVRHFETRAQEHLSAKPTPTEVSLHEHPPTRDDFKIALKTIHTKIGEALLYKEVDPSKRINANKPAFSLKLF